VIRTQHQVPENWLRDWDKHFLIAFLPSKYSFICFDNLIETWQISKSEIFEMGDEFSKDGICFTDGVGMISRTVAEEVQKMLGLEYLPSAFQVNWFSTQLIFL
jgi:hypothetical protein